LGAVGNFTMTSVDLLRRCSSSAAGRQHRLDDLPESVHIELRLRASAAWRDAIHCFLDSKGESVPRPPRPPDSALIHPKKLQNSIGLQSYQIEVSAPACNSIQMHRIFRGREEPRRDY